jgi:predicted DNA-binding protein (UPF0251 family)
MVRPRKCRRVSLNPTVRFYKPQGVPVRQLQTFPLMEEELEALYLADVQAKDHDSAATLMGISRPTFSRILAQARKTVARALVEGAALKIERGDCERMTAPTETDNNKKGTNDASNG